MVVWFQERLERARPTDSTKIRGVHTADHLNQSINMTALPKKVQQSLHFLLRFHFFFIRKDKGIISNALFLFQTNMSFLLGVKYKPSFNQTKPFLNKGLIKQTWIPQFGINKV